MLLQSKCTHQQQLERKLSYGDPSVAHVTTSEVFHVFKSLSGWKQDRALLCAAHHASSRGLSCTGDSDSLDVSLGLLRQPQEGVCASIPKPHAMSELGQVAQAAMS